MRFHGRCGHAWDRWSQQFLAKIAMSSAEVSTERQTEQLLELAERIDSTDSN